MFGTIGPELSRITTGGNAGSPGEAKRWAKLIAEEVERCLEAGWEIAAPLGNGR